MKRSEIILDMIDDLMKVIPQELLKRELELRRKSEYRKEESVEDSEWLVKYIENTVYDRPIFNFEIFDDTIHCHVDDCSHQIDELMAEKDNEYYAGWVDLYLKLGLIDNAKEMIRTTFQLDSVVDYIEKLEKK